MAQPHARPHVAAAYSRRRRRRWPFFHALSRDNLEIKAARPLRSVLTYETL